MIANMYRISFGGDENVMELGSGDGCTAFVTILKTIELYTYLKEWILWHVNYMSLKMLFFF